MTASKLTTPLGPSSRLKYAGWEGMQKLRATALLLVVAVCMGEDAAHSRPSAMVWLRRALAPSSVHPRPARLQSPGEQEADNREGRRSLKETVAPTAPQWARDAFAPSCLASATKPDPAVQRRAAAPRQKLSRVSIDEACETPRSSRAECLLRKPTGDTSHSCLAIRGNSGALALVVGGGAGPCVAWRGGVAEAGGRPRVLEAGGCRDWKLGSRGCSRDWQQLTRSRGSVRRALDDGLASRPVPDSSRRAHRLSRFHEHAGRRSVRRFRLSRSVETSAPELACEGGSLIARLRI